MGFTLATVTTAATVSIDMASSRGIASKHDSFCGGRSHISKRLGFPQQTPQATGAVVTAVAVVVAGDAVANTFTPLQRSVLRPTFDSSLGRLLLILLGQLLFSRLLILWVAVVVFRRLLLTARLMAASARTFSLDLRRRLLF